MAASMLQKLSRKSAASSFFAALHTRPSTNVVVPFVHQPHLADIKPDAQFSTNPNLSLFFDSTPKKNSTHSQFFPIYPSFPFGFHFQPILPIRSTPSIADNDSGMIWADSVKKKRKKKMNKHKYKKLRKRLRRQT